MSKPIMMLVELRDVYDGYSVVVYEDGTIENRWDEVLEEYPEDRGVQRRQRLTQEWIDKQKEEQNGE